MLLLLDDLIHIMHPKVPEIHTRSHANTTCKWVSAQSKLIYSLCHFFVMFLQYLLLKLFMSLDTVCTLYSLPMMTKAKSNQVCVCHWCGEVHCGMPVACMPVEKRLVEG